MCTIFKGEFAISFLWVNLLCWLSMAASLSCTAWKVSIFGVILVRIFPHSYFPAEILRICPYSVRIRKYTDQNNSEYGHFSRSAASYIPAAFVLKQWSIFYVCVLYWKYEKHSFLVNQSDWLYFCMLMVRFNINDI